jgi:hypothetical protein
MDAYASLIQNSILGTDTVKIPTRARAPAWKTTPTLVYTLDDMNDFPAAASKPANDDRSTGSTASMTSNSTSAEAIKKIETQWKTDKAALSTNLETTLNARLATMDTKIDKAVATINETVTREMARQFESFEIKMLKIVTDKIGDQSGTITTNVSESVTGKNSPYVTSATLTATLDAFLAKIESRIDRLTEAADSNGSPVSKKHKTTPRKDTSEDGGMDIDPAAVTLYAVPTDNVGGQKN